MGGKLLQMRCEAADKQQSGIANDRFVAFLVLGEPLAVVVALKLSQELEELGAEEGSVGHRESLGARDTALAKKEIGAGTNPAPVSVVWHFMALNIGQWAS